MDQKKPGKAIYSVRLHWMIALLSMFVN